MPSGICIRGGGESNLAFECRWCCMGFKSALNRDRCTVELIEEVKKRGFVRGMFE